MTFINKEEEKELEALNKRLQEERNPSELYWGDSPDDRFFVYTKSHPRKDNYDPQTYTIPKQR